MHQELLELFQKRPTVIKPGLERIHAAISALAGKIDLGLKTPCVLVGGTNGKGSTSAFLYQLLAASGLRVGLFTSPHLIHFSERIRISEGKPLTDSDLVAALARLRGALPPQLYDDLSFFEVNTLLAWQVFAEHQTAINVLEVGLGGRWDATNAAEPVLSIISSIGLDHQQYLGSTYTAIAREKAGIMRTGKPVLWGATGPQEADQAIREAAAHIGAHLLDAPTAHAIVAKVSALPPQAAAWPAYLIANWQLAAAAFLQLAMGDAKQAFARFKSGAVPSAPSLIGRFQLIEAAPQGARQRRLLLDVCHNPDGAAAFVAGLRRVYGEQRLPAIISIFGDKDFNAILDRLREVLKDIVLYPQAAERSWQREQLAARHQDLHWEANLASAWRWHEHQPQTEPLVCCGSVHGIGELLTFLDYRI